MINLFKYILIATEKNVIIYAAQIPSHLGNSLEINTS